MKTNIIQTIQATMQLHGFTLMQTLSGMFAHPWVYSEIKFFSAEFLAGFI
jgi:hypothetical protein